MSTETTNKKIKIDNGTTFGRTYTDKAIDAKLPTDLIATAKKLSLGAGNTALGNGVNLDGFTYDEATKTLKASGGGSGGDAFDIITLSPDMETYTGVITGKKPVLLKSSTEIYIACYVYEWTYSDPHQIHAIFMFPSFGSISALDCHDNEVSFTEVKYKFYYHFITMTYSDSSIALYLTIQNTSETEFDADTLASYLAGKKVLVNGNLHGVVPTYIAGEGGSIKVYYMTPGDSNINPTPDEYQDLSSFTITDLVTPVE